MRWSDKGIVISVKKYGENSLIIHLLTINHGVHAGLVRYNTTKKSSYNYELGNVLSATFEKQNSLNFDVCKGMSNNKYYNVSDKVLNLTSQTAIQTNR